MIIKTDKLIETSPNHTDMVKIGGSQKT